VLTERGLARRSRRWPRAPRSRSRSSSCRGPARAGAEATAYFTVAEALTNVAKYAEATTRTVRVAPEDGALVVEVRDDGVGGARRRGGSGSAAWPTASGLATARSASSPPGEGTLVRAVLPMAGAASGGQAPAGAA
jgi:signal transduction histidine kinase